MAYVSGDLILDDHYNDFAADVNDVWGTGSGDFGYGQSSTIATVAPGTTITATQWATLINRIKSISNHQGSNASITLDSVTNPVTGDTIEVYNTMSTDIATIRTNRLNAAANGTDITNNLNSTSSWTTQTTHTITWTFGSANAARYYFNAGGQLLFSFSRSGGSGTTKNSEWTDLCSDCGTLIIKASSFEKSGGSGSPSINATTTGFHDLTTSYTILFKQFADSSPYTANYIQLQASINAGGDQVTTQVIFRDDASDTISDTVDGTLTTTYTERPPSLTYISDTWGTVTTGTSQSQS